MAGQWGVDVELTRWRDSAIESSDWFVSDFLSVLVQIPLFFMHKYGI
ncbi:Unannotated [Lentimonas sp. CC4]|nr:Unannotated [Lentimonas sp. CC4]CAA6684958.1 Unannotated [Lentimonas sp. CC6]CAA7077927.1 Unannotated [Lentimonas sp. CC4]CAA7169851.1 Unannotated [Lentimonas sp. CC21]